MLRGGSQMSHLFSMQINCLFMYLLLFVVTFMCLSSQSIERNINNAFKLA